MTIDTSAPTRDQDGRKSWIGRSLRRKEDGRFVTGRGQYVDDIVVPGMLHAAMLRCPYPHALVKRIDASRALELPGVYGVLTGAEVAQAIEPEKGLAYPRGGSWYYMAVDRARFVGEIVAVVAAEDRYVAEDALALIDVEYEPLPALLDPERATEPDAPVLHPDAPGGNEVLQQTWNFGDVEGAFARADVVVSERLVVHRHSATPLEGLAAIASYDPGTGQSTVWANVGNLTRYTAAVRALRDEHTDVRMIVPDVGGHFGVKAWVHQRAVLLALLSKKVGRPVKWTEDRAEHLAASHHATGRIGYVEAAATRDGELLGLKLRLIDDQGAYTCLNEPFGPSLLMMNGLIGCYKLENLRVETHCVLTNKVPVASNRGYGRVQQFFVLERIVDLVARKLGMDPGEVRRRNFLQPEDYPYRTPSGTLYDSGDPTALLTKAQELLGYDDWRREQARARGEGRLIGIGLCASVEGAGPNQPQLARGYGVQEKHGMSTEVASLHLGPDGRVSVQTPTLCQGQGHETTISQIVAEHLGVDPESVRVTVRFDSATMSYTPISGTFGSRFSSTGAMAVYGAAQKLRSQLAELAGRLLEASPQDLEFVDGRIQVRGAPDRGMTVKQLAATAHTAPDAFGMGPDMPLQATYRSNWPTADYPDEQGLYNGMNTYAILCHAAVVEVDADTGAVKVMKYVSMEDCGRLVNPSIVRGQTLGGLAHGLGWALTERFAYDDQGQMLTSTFMDYLPVRFTDVPPVQVGHIDHPTPFSPLGAKGMGEGGAIPAPACIANAVDDAIAHQGGPIRDSHLPPETVLRALRDARPAEAK